jgi:hypothetical protein
MEDVCPNGTFLIWILILVIADLPQEELKAGSAPRTSRKLYTASCIFYCFQCSVCTVLFYLFYRSSH